MKLYYGTRRMMATAALIGVTEPAAAQRVEGGDVLEAVSRCRRETDAPQRLACFDRAVRTSDTARSENGATLVTREDLRDQRQARFGLDGRTPASPMAKAAKPPEIESLDSSVARVGPSGRDRFLMTFADRSVWRTIEPARWPPRVGDGVHVRRGALGSYLGSFAKMRSIRIERVR